MTLSKDPFSGVAIEQEGTSCNDALTRNTARGKDCLEAKGVLKTCLYNLGPNMK